MTQELDGIYIISIPLEDTFGPPQPGEEEEEDVETEEVGKIEIKGDQVTNLDPENQEIQDLIAGAFRREGKKVKNMYVDSHILIKNGSPGFAGDFLNYLDFLDYTWRRE